MSAVYEQTTRYCDNEYCEDAGVEKTVTVVSRDATSATGYWECATCAVEQAVDREPDRSGDRAADACQCPPTKPGAVSFGCRCGQTPEQAAEFNAEWSRWVD